MPLLWKKMLLAVKTETTSGTVIALANADANENFYNVEMEPDIANTSRDAQLSFDSLASIQELRGGTCKFRTDCRGDGAAGVPFWASVLLPACGFSVSTQTFSPKTEAPGTNVKTVTMGLFEDGRKKLMRGCAGNAKFTFETGKLAYIDWDFKGAWLGVSDAAILAPTYPTKIPFRVANATFALGSWVPCFAKMEIDLGNVVELRPCQTPADGTGIEAAIISDRKIKGTVDPEAALVATADPFGDWGTPTERALAFDLEDAVDKIAFAAPKYHPIGVKKANRAGVIIDQIDFELNKNAGNDALTIVFSAP